MHQQSARPAPSTATFPQPAEVAAILQVSPKTISRWAKHGRDHLPHQHTLGAHRHPEPDIRQLLASLIQKVRAS
jgi:predicted site-specific integrase-resolvase